MWIVILVILLSNILLIINCYDQQKKVKSMRQLSDKHLEMFLLMNRWLQNKSAGKSIGDYLRNIGIENVIIYGMSYIGKCLYEELEKEGFEISDIIDKKSNIYINKRKVKNLNEKIELADAIIVTAIYYFDELEIVLKNKFNIPIMAIDDIIYKM